MKKIVLSLLAGFMIVSTPLLAETTKTESGQKFRPNPWTDCGIGAIVAPKNKAVAVLSNTIWDFGSTGMTSASSSQGTCRGNDTKVARFVEKRYDLLEEEVAKGGGDNLSHVMDMLDCDDEMHEAAITYTREEMGKHVFDPGYAESSDKDKKANLYFSLVKAADKSCSK